MLRIVSLIKKKSQDIMAEQSQIIHQKCNKLKKRKRKNTVYMSIICLSANDIHGDIYIKLRQRTSYHVLKTE